MKIELWDYQQHGVRRIREAFKDGHQRIFCVSPTGSGKGTVIPYIMAEAVKKGLHVLCVIHRKELIEDVVTRLYKQQGIMSTMIMANSPKTNYPAKVASIQTLSKRKKPKIDLLIIDEAHRLMADSYLKLILEDYPDVKCLFFTATPTRGDKKSFAGVVTKIVQFTTTAKLIEKKRLTPLRYVMPKETVDFKKIKLKKNNDFDEHDMFLSFDEDRYYKAVVDKYNEWLAGKPAIVFCINREHAKRQADYFVKSGIRAASIDGETETSLRNSIIKRYARGELDVLINCELFIEGFDVPRCAGVIINRATKTVGRYIQMAGRGARPVWGKNDEWAIDIITGQPVKEYCILIDFGGNVERFGFWEDYDRFGFQLGEKEEKDDGKSKVKTCPNCENISRASDKVCGTCGVPYPIRGRLAGWDVDNGLYPDEVEWVVREPERVILLPEVIAQIKAMSQKEIDDAPVSLYRIIRIVHSFNKMWVWKKAIENKLVPSDASISNKEDTDKLAHLLRSAEERAGVYDTYQSLLQNVTENY